MSRRFGLLRIIFMLIASFFIRTGEILLTPGINVQGTPSFANISHASSNNVQHNASVQMEEFDSKLLFTMLEETYIPHDCVLFLDGNELKKVYTLPTYEMLIGMEDGYIFFSVRYSYGHAVDVLDLRTGNKKELYMSDYSISCQSLLSIEDNTYISLSSHGDYKYLKIRDGELLEVVDELPGYTVGKYMYYYTNGRLENLYRRDISGNIEDLEIEGKIEVCQMNTGLIINDSIKSGLYHVGEDGEIKRLLPFECIRCKSAFATSGKYVFYSVIRYSGFDSDNKVYTTYEDDYYSGTFRIDTEDFSVEKISDYVYDGLFIFDNESIFACDTGKNIYQLDMDGRVLKTVISH